MKKTLSLGLLLVAGGLSAHVSATDLFRLSGSAASDGAGGLVGLSPNAQSALLSNPSLLSELEDGVSVGITALRVNSEFTSSLGELARADKGPGIIPELAYKDELGDSDWSWAAGAVVQSAMKADFRFQDPPGTAGVSYGLQPHAAEWLVAKFAGALSYRFSDQLSAGVSLALAYNRNQLEAPYIFQSHPVLQGLKVLVDLDVDDLGFASSLGLNYKPSESLAMQLAYSLATDFSADGDLSGNLAQLGLGIQEDFHYQANVQTTLPASLMAGLTWQASDRLRLGLQLDRIFWEDAFDVLPIRLSEGSNSDLNSFLGANFIHDVAPLQWQDQDSLHLGGEYLLRGAGKLRLGYESSEAQAPGHTVTPMTGAILDEAFTAGLQFRLGQRDYDIAYRYSRGDDLTVVDSALAGGEYDNTAQSLKLHSLRFSFRL